MGMEKMYRRKDYIFITRPFQPSSYIIFLVKEEYISIETSYLPKDFRTEHHETPVDFGDSKRFCAREVTAPRVFLRKEVFKDVIAKQITPDAEPLPE